MKPQTLQSALVFGVLSSTLFLDPLGLVQAQPSQGELFASNVTFVPPNGDRPKDSQGGASRDDGKCPQDAKNTDPYLTAVVPADVQRLTVQSQPSIFVYIPQTTAKKAFFSLKDDKNGQHYQTFLPIDKKGGIVKVNLPANAPSLVVGNDYQWSFVMLCGDKLLPDDPAVTGTIRRVNPGANVTGQWQDWQQNPSLETANLLGKAGLWYDMLTVLMALKLEQPNNVQLSSIWSSVLKASNLDSIATQPVIARK
ncbi:MAG: DUF928 domain-containing protein [Crocosphaera sp.]|nr:DUF928 domain-containing protein [Crocosphaera sp.]